MSSPQGETIRIESQDLTLENVFKDFYSVPDFQREYVWGQLQVEKLLADVMDEFYDEERRLLTSMEYFLGSMVVCRAADGTFSLIDGQQRMTTIYLVLCAIRDALAEANADPGDVLRGQIAAASMNPETYEEVHRHRLALQYEDSDGVLERIVKANEPVSAIKETTVSVRNILAAYRLIREFLVANLDGDPKRLRQFHGAFMMRIKLIRIATPNLANALKVFETINDRGVGLNAMDLLKNLLFIKTKAPDYPKLKDRWKGLINTLDGCQEKPLRFLRYYIMAHHPVDYHRGVREDEIYDWFVCNAESCGITTAPVLFTERLAESAKAYAGFLAGLDAGGQPNRYLSNLSLLSGAARQHFILLLAGRRLSPDLFSKLCRHIENLFFCYIITREPTKNFERNFARWSGELRAVTTEAELDGFLARYLTTDLAGRSAAFDFAFSEMNQSRIQQYRLRYVLAKLCQHVEQEAWGNPQYTKLGRYIDSSVEVEHILPQNPTAAVREGFDRPDEYGDYVGRLGNLTLLERTINASVSNDGFAGKSPGYRQSSLLLTKSLAEKPHVGADTAVNRAVADLIQFDHWNSETIGERQSMLGKLARRVWDIPASGRPPAEGHGTTTGDLQVRFWTGFSDYLRQRGFSLAGIPKPRPQQWMGFGIGRSGFYVAAIACLTGGPGSKDRTGQIRMEFTIDRAEDGAELFARLKSRRGQLEDALGTRLTWYEAAGVRARRVWTEKPADVADEAAWPDCHVWLYEWLVKFHDIFRPLAAEFRSAESADA